MLVICNGAFKSGSSWLHALVASIMRCRDIDLTPVPKEYSLGKSPVTLISENRLAEFIEREDICSNNYLTKAHFFSEPTLRRTYPNEVIFLFMERDLRDAVVSHYYHFIAMMKMQISFGLYYRLVGRYKAYEISLFNHRCRQYFGDDNFFVYEAMKANTAVVIQRLCGILGLAPLTSDELRSVMDQTSLDAMRNKAKAGQLVYYQDAGNRHVEMYRKGIVGEYKKHFDTHSLRDIDEITRLNLSAVDKAIYKWLFTYRRALR